MEYRVKNIIETLKQLPQPEYINQVLQVPIMMESWERNINYNESQNPCKAVENVLRVKAEGFSNCHGDKWLEWVYDVSGSK
jgi:hypothetical protein